MDVGGLRNVAAPSRLLAQRYAGRAGTQRELLRADAVRALFAGSGGVHSAGGALVEHADGRFGGYGLLSSAAAPSIKTSVGVGQRGLPAPCAHEFLFAIAKPQSILEQRLNP
jgi:hypothetical protein